jgi:pyrroloquinoline quinone biosynthesis protein D
MADSAKYRRRDGIAWREEEEATREVLDALAEGKDVSQEGTMLLVDRGRVFELNMLGAAVWKLCDGTRGVDRIVEELLPQFDVGREELDADVRGFLEDLCARGWMVTQ